MTKDTTTYPSLVGSLDAIEDAFDIDWKSVSWEDLRKPMYSALAARLYLSILSGIEMVPVIGDIDGQASYWKRYYDTETDNGMREEYFKAKLANCQGTINCAVPELDIVFVMDGSGSITTANFELSKAFVANTIDTFQIGPDKTRIGVMQYTSGQRIEIALGSENDKVALQTKVNNIAYISGSTRTGAAIDYTVSHPDLFGGVGRNSVPRVCIVITDGLSHDDVQIPADNARDSYIILFAVGVGGYVIDELNMIANDPDEVYRFEVPTFQTIENIRNALALTTCLASGTLDDLGNPFSSTNPPGGFRYLEIPIPDSGMITFTLHTPKGEACAYLSTLLPNPNSAFYEWKVTTTAEDDFEQVFIDVSTDWNVSHLTGNRRKRQSEQALTLYVSIINTGDTENNFTVNAEEGNTVIEVPTTPASTTLPPTTTPTQDEPTTALPTTTLPPATTPTQELLETSVFVFGYLDVNLNTKLKIIFDLIPTTDEPTTALPTTTLPPATTPTQGTPDMGPTESLKNNRKSSGSTIAIIVVVLVIVAVTVFLVVFFFLRKRNQSGRSDPAEDHSDEIPGKEGDTERLDDQSNQVTVMYGNNNPSTVTFTKDGNDTKGEQSKAEDVTAHEDVDVSGEICSKDAAELSQEVGAPVCATNDGEEEKSLNNTSMPNNGAAKESEPDIADQEPPTTN
ncbi:uncharacterized protein [Amphiura filiformis]|uniref:uncharacterized protein n=1 Tax=Amphiura filiformis TaxID=82378 RepID=UPI003B21691C